jgi:hypothetical protein
VVLVEGLVSRASPLCDFAPSDAVVTKSGHSLSALYAQLNDCLLVVTHLLTDILDVLKQRSDFWREVGVNFFAVW